MQRDVLSPWGGIHLGLFTLKAGGIIKTTELLHAQSIQIIVTAQRLEGLTDQHISLTAV